MVRKTQMFTEIIFKKNYDRTDVKKRV